MVTVLHPLDKTESSQKRSQVIESDVGIRGAAKDLEQYSLAHNPHYDAVRTRASRQLAVKRLALVTPMENLWVMGRCPSGSLRRTNIPVAGYEDGAPGEIYITMAKEGSTISGLMDDFATAVGFNLQFGVPIHGSRPSLGAGRNAQVTVIAPTGTIGFMMDCDTTGIEPDLALIKYKKLVGGGVINRSSWRSRPF